MVEELIRIQPQHLHNYLVGTLPPQAVSYMALKIRGETLFVRLSGSVDQTWFLMVRRYRFRRHEVFHTLYVSTGAADVVLKKWRRATMLRWLHFLDHLGVAVVRCHANLTRGGYLWAAAGFLPENAEEWKAVRDYARKSWQDLRSMINGRVPEQEVARIDRLLGLDDPRALTIWAAQKMWAEVPPAIFANSRFASTPDTVRSLGNLILAGSSWWGNLQLNEAEAYSAFRESMAR